LEQLARKKLIGSGKKSGKEEKNILRESRIFRYLEEKENHKKDRLHMFSRREDGLLSLQRTSNKLKLPNCPDKLFHKVNNRRLKTGGEN